MSTSKAEMKALTMPLPKIASKEEWLKARKELLAEEKALTHARDALAAKRRELPWVKIEKSYAFDAPTGKKSLADLFEGRSQLFVYHFMFGPDWKEGCPSCSMVADGFDGVNVHLAQRDVMLTVVSRAPLAQIETFKKRMGWRFNWVSSFGGDFNRDFGVTFTKDDIASGKIYNFGTSGFPVEEAPGLSVFAKRGNGIFHTYSSYGRGLEEMLGVYFMLDRVPKGRDEEGIVPHPMGWVRHHDRYDAGKLVELK